MSTHRSRRMIRDLSLCLLLSVACGCARAEAPTPLLWRASDGDNSVYLLGSFHLLKPGDYPLAASVDEAFDDAESLLFELSPAEMSDPALGQKLATAARFADGRSLRESVSAETWARLEAYAGARGIAIENLHGFEPWFVALTISIIEMQRTGLDPSLGLDRHLMERAAKAGKPASGLETGDMQVALFDGMSEDEQRQSLEETLGELDGFEAEIDRLHGYWRSGDGDGMFDEMGAEMRDKYPKLYRRINVDRNRAWLPRLEQILARSGDGNDALVVVGSLHLLGPDGVVELLRAKGYTVERL